MKRLALTLCASLLLVALAPGLALGVTPPSNLDQDNEPVAGNAVNTTSTHDMGQTFTAGKSGLLSGVDLNMDLNPAATVTVHIESTTGGMPSDTVLTSGSASVGTSNAWIHFSLVPPISVAAGTVYAIVFNTGGSADSALGQGNNYAGGETVWKNPTWAALGGPFDLWFRTYVDDVGTQLSWDKSQVTAGVNTPLTLTATMTYINGVEANHYSAILGLLPTWFTATGLTCSDTASKIVPADCTLVNFGNGFGSLIPASATGDIMTFTVTGTAHPLLADLGSNGLTGANACINYPALGFCSDNTANVLVVAAGTSPTPTRAATLPPTSTGVGPSSDESGRTTWFLPIGLIALFGGLLTLVTRRRRPIIS